MKQYNVTGMSCAACSAAVEKAVNAVNGVTACSVSLLTNSMGVEGSADESAVIAAVEKAGYGASVKGGTKSTQNDDAFLKDTETPKIAKRLIASLSQTIPQVESNLFRATENVVLNKVLGYKINGERHTFLEDY